MTDPTETTTNLHSRYAARRPAGTEHPITLTKNGVYHKQRMPDGSEREIIACGLACSECFSGPNLARILQPGLELEQQVMRDLAAGKPAAPLSIHTSSGVTTALSPFMEALEIHLPWKNHQELDWCVSLQMEGASAVWAAIDMVLQVNIMEQKLKNKNGDSSSTSSRTKVAVGATSYHGPPSTSFGAMSPLWYKNHQLIYPVPTAYGSYDEAELLSKYETFLDDHAHEVGAILFEPQWGSSQAALPWPEHLLKTYVRMARERGIKIICDEIMCGLGRHGKGTLFVSEAWDLDPDCVTFGKAVATGLFPLSGAILKQGRDLLHKEKCSVMQSHTYAGSSTRALMAATEVLKEFVLWLPSVAHLGDEMGHIMQYLTDMSQGMFICHGQGLMWGGIVSQVGQNANTKFRSQVVQAFKKNCEEACIVPYYVPVGGFMVSPVIDIDVATIYEIGQRLEQAIQRTMEEVGWVATKPAALPSPNAIATASTLNLAELAGAEASERNDDDDVLLRASINSNTSKTLAELGRRGSVQMMKDLGNDMCVPYLHATKCCTSCGNFVCQNVRTRFVRNSLASNSSSSMSAVAAISAKKVQQQLDVVYDQFGETEPEEETKTVASSASGDGASTASSTEGISF